MNKIVTAGLKFVRSGTFFWLIVVLLVLQAIWFALTLRYPMAFDENFHFGIIKLYAQQWSPYFAHEPSNSSAYGDLVRNSSFLYHYLMSFPYRFIELFTHNQPTQVIFLRFINIGLFAGGLIFFRQVLRRLHISDAITNVSLFMLVLIPVVPFLAATINYDNLMFLVIPLITWLTLRCVEILRSDHKLSAAHLTFLLTSCFLASLIKYAFLPIFVALVLYLILMIWRYRPLGTIFKNTCRDFLARSFWIKLGLVICLVISGSMFIERYGVNIVQYHSLQPDCSALRNVDECMQYGPWARNYEVKMGVAGYGGPHAPYDPNPALFVPAWIDGMMERLYFAINYDYSNYPGLPIILFSAYVVGGFGLILGFVYARRLLRHQHQLVLLLLVTIVYTVSVFYVNLNGYRHLHAMQAINGRYLVLIFPFAFAFMVLAYNQWFQAIAKRRSQSVKLGFLVLITILTLQGAGMLTFLVRSNPNWWWENQTVIDVNDRAKSIVSPFIIGG